VGAGLNGVLVCSDLIKGKIKKQIASNLIEGYPAGNYLA
jgi:hypothetical protein